MTPDPAPIDRAAAAADPAAVTRAFHRLLRREVEGGNPRLGPAEQELLRSHYPIMMQPARYPPPLVEKIYARRRAPAVAAVVAAGDAAATPPVVFDAGCGYGSESFLFAALGAEVLAVDRSPAQVAVARRRLAWYEELLGRPLAVTFGVADLDVYAPERSGLALTWLSSVLAAIPDQEGLLRRVCAATRAGGEVMITDMNLLNPLFLWKTWRRQRRFAARDPAFAQGASLGDVFWARRRGARYLPQDGGDPLDDPQFFWWKTQADLLRRAGFVPGRASYSGYVPPLPGAPDLSALEDVLARLPVLRCGAYFYRMSGVKMSGLKPGEAPA